MIFATEDQPKITSLLLLTRVRLRTSNSQTPLRWEPFNDIGIMESYLDAKFMSFIMIGPKIYIALILDSNGLFQNARLI